MSRLWKSFTFALWVCFLGSLVFAPAADALKPQAKVKAAFIFNGPIGDHGWIFAHERARRELQKVPYVETAYTESVPAGDAERIMKQYIRRGYNLIFGCTFEYMDIMLNLSKRNPDWSSCTWPDSNRLPTWRPIGPRSISRPTWREWSPEG